MKELRPGPGFHRQQGAHPSQNRLTRVSPFWESQFTRFTLPVSEDKPSKARKREGSGAPLGKALLICATND